MDQKEIDEFVREMCGNCSYLDCHADKNHDKQFEECLEEYKKELNVPATLQDIIEFAKQSDNDNPSIWIIDSENDDYDQACRFDDIDLDENGDIIIKVSIEMLQDN